MYRTLIAVVRRNREIRARRAPKQGPLTESDTVFLDETEVPAETEEEKKEAEDFEKMTPEELAEQLGEEGKAAEEEFAPRAPEYVMSSLLPPLLSNYYLSVDEAKKLSRSVWLRYVGKQRKRRRRKREPRRYRRISARC